MEAVPSSATAENAPPHSNGPGTGPDLEELSGVLIDGLRRLGL